MSVIKSNQSGLGGSGDVGGALGSFYSYTLDQSLRFEDGDSPALSKTYSTAQTNTKIITVSVWVKRANLGIRTAIMFAKSGSSGWFEFGTDDKLRWNPYNTGYNAFKSTRVFRDTSAWYHIVATADSENQSGANIYNVYVNGEQLTNSDGSSHVPDDTATKILANGITTYIGDDTDGAYHFDGYLAEMHVIDGSVVAHTEFGETKDGVWVPKEYSGSYGNNGFYLPFSHDTVSEGFTPLIYTGNGTGQSISGVGFQPDLVWLKTRSTNYQHSLYDSVRGGRYRLASDVTVGDVDNASANLQSFDADGFTVSTLINDNQNNTTYIAWCWEAGGAPTVDNSAGAGATPTAGSVKIDGSNLGSALGGSIAATRLSANTSKGFSIVGYEGTGSNATVAHGLSSAPELIIIKERDNSNGWAVSINGDATDFLRLDQTGARSDDDAVFNDTAPTSTVFSIGTAAMVNRSGGSMIAYCWHSVSGYSSIGSYTGSGSTGKAITGLGFRPVFVMIKRTDSGGGWHVFDAARFPNNPIDERIEWDNNDAENSAATVDIDFDSDGFTLQTTFDNMNASSGEYIYMAFADTRDSVFHKDTSGNLNNFTPSNLDVNDVVPDSPTNNFGTMNPLDKNSMTVSGGNLKVVPSADYKAIRGTFGIPTSGKWYFEARILTPGGGNVQDNQIGVVTQQNVLTGTSPYPQGFTYGVGYFGSGKINRAGSTAQSSLTAFTAGKILGVAVNVDDDEVQFYLDGSAVGTTEQLVSTTEPNFAFYVGATNRGVVFNFGQDSTFAGATTAGGNADANGIGDFKYAPPSGHLALCSSNLPDITIGPGQSSQADEHFDTVLYTGNGNV